MKQSSIEWLAEQIREYGIVNEACIDQAKQIHKQEVIEAYEEGADTGEMFNNENRVFTTDAKQYYKNTYEKEQSKKTNQKRLDKQND